MALERAVAEAVAGHVEAAAIAHALLERPEADGAERLARAAHGLAQRLRQHGVKPQVPAEAELLHLDRGSSRHQHDALRLLMSQGRISGSILHLTPDAEALARELGTSSAALSPALLALAVPFALRRRGVELKLVAGTRHITPVPDATLVSALARAHRWVRAMRDGRSLTSIAQAERTSEAYVRMRALLAFLAPRIQAAILSGAQPPEMTLERLVRTGVPLDWDEQGRVLGIDAAG